MTAIFTGQPAHEHGFRRHRILYVGLVNPYDELHANAVESARRFQGVVVTTEYVLVELGNRLARSGDKQVFIEVIRELESDPRVTVVPAGPSLFQRGLAMMASRLDKDWSLTDCISFVVMEERNIIEALTADHHFEQAGFVALLK